jgi:hypothetical protein
MDKRRKISVRLFANENGEFPIRPNVTYLKYERDAAFAVTISPSVTEREGEKIDASGISGEGPAFATILTDANVRRGTEILRRHGLVVIRGLLTPCQTVPWGDAVLADFDSAAYRLRWI